jgi:hypothetical protein
MRAVEMHYGPARMLQANLLLRHRRTLLHSWHSGNFTAAAAAEQHDSVGSTKRAGRSSGGRALIDPSVRGLHDLARDLRERADASSLMQGTRS